MSKLLVQIFKVFLTLLIPLMIVLGVTRLVTTVPFLAFEYSKSDFPEDPFGFDSTQRLTHAADNFQFVTKNQPLADLTGQKHNDAQLYNARELKHMQDVQNVYQVGWRVWQIVLTVVVICGLMLVLRKENRPAFASAVRWGGALTVGLVVVIGLTAIVAWQGWFVFFHQLFFTAGSWTFDFSNTLIRLFPGRFWYDAALTISSLSVIAGFLIYWMGSHLNKIDADKLFSPENEQN
jgi:integral membrane protein (TIGR01906 family)